MSKTPAKQYTLKTREKLTVRTAVPQDARPVLEMARTILAEDLYNIRTLDEFKMTVDAERQWIQRHIENPGQMILVAELTGAIGPCKMSVVAQRVRQASSTS